MIPVRLSLCLDRPFAKGKVKLGESRRTLYGVVGVQASQTQFPLLCLVVVLPIFANRAVYSKKCMQTSGLAKSFSWSWSWNCDFVLGAQSRLGRSGYRSPFCGFDMDRSVRKNEEHKREVSMRWYHAAIEPWGKQNVEHLWVPPGGLQVL